MTQIAEGISWKRIYWVNGGRKALREAGVDDVIASGYEVSDPPCNGWQGCLVMDLGKKGFIILDPNSGQSFQVSNEAAEVVQSADAPFSKDRIVKKILYEWKRTREDGPSPNYEHMALALHKMGVTPPKERPKSEQSVNAKGGKPVGEKLLKPVKPEGKRGKLLAWFLEDTTRSLPQAMAVFEDTRSSILSMAYMLNKDHGIGYNVEGDMLGFILPEGCESPFDGAQAG